MRIAGIYRAYATLMSGYETPIMLISQFILILLFFSVEIQEQLHLLHHTR